MRRKKTRKKKMATSYKGHAPRALVRRMEDKLGEGY